MSKAKLINFVYLVSPKHKATGRTKHFLGAEQMAEPYQLKIIQYPADSGYYLIYLDKNGNELTDTYHETLQKAFEQAQWEFSVEPREWKKA